MNFDEVYQALFGSLSPDEVVRCCELVDGQGVGLHDWLGGYVTAVVVRLPFADRMPLASGAADQWEALVGSLREALARRDAPPVQLATQRPKLEVVR